MFELNGQYGSAKVFVKDETKLEDSAKTQILDLLNNPYVEGSKISIMPDCHGGKGCVVGFTQTIKDKVVPSLIGCDIGCSVLVVKLSKGIHLDMEELDRTCHRIPSGMRIRNTPLEEALPFASELDKVYATINKDRALKSLGSLGGGNHYQECDIDNNGQYYLTIHSGSRHLGLEIESFYTGKTKNALTVLEGEQFEKYCHDMKIAQEFGMLNRELMMRCILRTFHITADQIEDTFTTMHNYLDLDNMIVRKGAISLKKDELAIIPMNMADGSLIVRGKGNAEWNYSGPHGAGRLMSRAKARKTLNMDDYRESMKDVYTTSVSEATLDESKMAYKPMQDIIDAIEDTAEIVEIIKPVYNFKAG